MEREKLESLLIDYIDGKLNSVDKHYVEQVLMKDAGAYRVYEELKMVIQTMNRVKQEEPPVNSRASFQTMLDEEMKLNKNGKLRSLYPQFYRVAAAVALIIIGVSLGFMYSNYRVEQQELARIQKEKEDAQVFVARFTNDSPGQRLLAVKATNQVEDPHDDILKALVKSMNEDPNANVRMAAIEALSRFHTEKSVRQALIESLGKQIDPVVQIMLIQVMVELREKEVLKPLRKIIENEEFLPAVKDEAHKGIFMLS